MADFDFVSVPELRRALESDYRELQSCLKAEAWKAVHVLAGSLVETDLIDALYAEKGVDQTKLDSMVLDELVKLGKQYAVLSGETVDLSAVVRRYRNLIHPGRVKRLEKVVNGNGAVVAAQLVEIITSEVARRKKETYGYTAEQLFERLKSGSSALPLVELLLKDCKHREVERLLIDIIPDSYFAIIKTALGSKQTADYTHVRHCYRAVFNAATDLVKQKVIKNIYEVYRNQPVGRARFRKRLSPGLRPSVLPRR